MRQIIAVLLQLPADPLLSDHFALQLDIKDAGTVPRDLQKVEFLSDMLDHVGEEEPVKAGDPAARGVMAAREIMVSHGRMPALRKMVS